MLSLSVDQAEQVGKPCLVFYARLIESGDHEYQRTDYHDDVRTVRRWEAKLAKAGLAVFTAVYGTGRVRMELPGGEHAAAKAFLARIAASEAGRHYTDALTADDYLFFRETAPTLNQEDFDNVLISIIADAYAAETRVPRPKLRKWIRRGLKIELNNRIDTNREDDEEWEKWLKTAQSR